MYVKVFRQIFDSSVAENYQTRWVFQDLLILADKTGVVDMTVTAISRTTGVPRELVAEAVRELEQPDTHSRNPDHEGRRLLRLDDHRDWGWKIANYEDYRDIQDEEARRGMWAQQKREQRSKERLRRMSRTLNGHLKTITDCPQLSANVRPSEAEAYSEADTEKEIINKSFALVSGEHPKKPTGRKLEREPQDWPTFKDYCVKHGCTSEQALYFYTTWKAAGWKTNGEPMNDWRSKVISWKTQGYGLSNKTK